MLNFLRKNRSGKAAVAALAAVTVFSLAGCGGEKAAAPQATLVKSMQVIKRDTPLVYDYTGFVQAQQEMELKAQVSGQITGKYFNGGETVQAGQILYTIDPRTYRANLLQAQANLANARAQLANASVDAERYTKLYEQSAVSKQTLDNAIMARDQAQASVNAQEAMLENAQIDMNETNVTAPFTGRIDTTALEVGNYVTDGQTTMATISNTDPVFVEFSMAEPEYLKLANTAVDRGQAAPLENTLSGAAGKKFILSYSCGVDVCGEIGEFHTIAGDGPVFHRPIPYCVRQLLDLGDYSVADITVPEKE